MAAAKCITFTARSVETPTRLSASKALRNKAASPVARVSLRISWCTEPLRYVKVLGATSSLSLMNLSLIRGRSGRKWSSCAWRRA